MLHLATYCTNKKERPIKLHLSFCPFFIVNTLSLNPSHILSPSYQELKPVVLRKVGKVALTVFCKVDCKVVVTVFAKFAPKSLATAPAPLPAIVAIAPERFLNLFDSLNE
jgi:hypothetical protein